MTRAKFHERIIHGRSLAFLGSAPSSNLLKAENSTSRRDRRGTDIPTKVRNSSNVAFPLPSFSPSFSPSLFPSKDDESTKRDRRVVRVGLIGRRVIESLVES